MDTKVKTPLWKSCFILFITSLLFFYIFAIGNAYNSLGPYIAVQFQLAPAKLGFISSLYFYTDLLFLIPAGIIVDRYSPRTVIALVLLVASTGVLLTPFAHSVTMLIISRLLMGFGGGFCFVGCIRIAVNWFQSKYLARASGFIVTMGMFGGFMVQTPLTILIHHIGWREAMVATSIVGYVIMLLIFLFVRDVPAHEEQVTRQRKALHIQTGALKCLKLALLKKQNWFCGIYTSLMNLPIFMLGALWGIPYLTQVQGFSVNDAATVSGMLYIGTMIGSPLLGSISDIMKSRTRPMQIAAILSIILIFAVIEISSHSFWVFLILFLLLGAITSAQIISYPAVVESSDPLVSSSATSVISMMCMGGGALIQPLFGLLLAYKGNGTLAHDIMSYPAANYKFAMYALPVAFIISLILSFLIRDTKGQRI